MAEVKICKPVWDNNGIKVFESPEQKDLMLVYRGNEFIFCFKKGDKVIIRGYEKEVVNELPLEVVGNTEFYCFEGVGVVG